VAGSEGCELHLAKLNMLSSPVESDNNVASRQSVQELERVVMQVVRRRASPLCWLINYAED
jgi:hypothetical protein